MVYFVPMAKYEQYKNQFPKIATNIASAPGNKIIVHHDVQTLTVLPGTGFAVLTCNTIVEETKVYPRTLTAGRMKPQGFNRAP